MTSMLPRWVMTGVLLVAAAGSGAQELKCQLVPCLPFHGSLNIVPIAHRGVADSDDLILRFKPRMRGR